MYIYKEETFQIIKAALEVHKTLGCGFTEKVYQDALEQEFIAQNIPYSREHPIQVTYKDKTLSSEFIPDFICFDKVIVELKAVEQLTGLHRAQTINYARVAKTKVALLLNFGAESLEKERFFNSNGIF